MYSKELRTIDNVSPVGAAQQVLSDLCAAQECERKKVEVLVVQTRHLDDFMASYQTLIDDLQQSEFITKKAERAIASARAAITKTQALIRDNEQKLANEKKRAEEVVHENRWTQRDEEIMSWTSMKKDKRHHHSQTS